MKFLIAEDLKELREIIVMDVSANYDVEVTEAEDGQDAIDCIQTKGPFDLIISDYNMPKKNGEDVYFELRKHSISTPYILISSQTEKFDKIQRQDKFVTTLNKPYSEAEFTKKIEQMLAHKSLLRQKASYLPVSIQILKKIEYPGVPLYIQLNHGQYIKVLKAESYFDNAEAERFHRKNLTHLFVELIDLKTLISNFRKNVFAKLDWENIDSKVALSSMQEDWQLILDCSRNFGWSDSIKNLAKENIAKTLVLIKKHPNLKNIYTQLKLSNNLSQVAPHCYFLVMLMSSILNELNWSSTSTLQKITFAALLHDMGLSDDIFAIKLQRVSELGFQSNTENENDLIISNHPIKSAEFVGFWSSCPPDVDKLILQHHERFDGNGFPNKLNFLTLFPLAGIFIMAEDIVYQIFLNNEINPIEYLKSHESYYNRGEFKKIYTAVLNVLSEVCPVITMK